MRRSNSKRNPLLACVPYRQIKEREDELLQRERKRGAAGQKREKRSERSGLTPAASFFCLAVPLFF